MDGPLSIPDRENVGEKASRRTGSKKPQPDRPQEGRAPIASAEECLTILSRLGGLVTLGFLTPAQANTIRAIYVAILQHHARQQSGPSRTVVNEKDLGKMLRMHPELGKMLEPLLSTAQIEAILGGRKDPDDADGAA
jgi:hypothetical protein